MPPVAHEAGERDRNEEHHEPEERAVALDARTRVRGAAIEALAAFA